MYKPEGFLISSPENHEYLSSPASVARAIERAVTLEAVALLCDASLNLHFEFGGMKAVMPRDEVLYDPAGGPVKDIAVLTRVGKPTCFRIVGLRREADGTETALLSRRAAQRACYEEHVRGLRPGDILPTRVTHLEAFGAFVDIGCGIVSLLPIDAISVSRISHPRDRLQNGDRLYVVIRSLDPAGRIYVSQRELLGTWEENAARFSVGETVAGIVRSIENYGIFVELAPNLAGLSEWKAGVEVGARAAVYIKSILPDKMKVKLVIIDAHKGPVPCQATPYFVDVRRVTHLDHWRYSPPGARKLVETVFE